ncbi:NAD(P)H-dependent oxidoreductase [Desulfovibrio sp. OttesenSCG-928-M14]|nr:NAD(P)H-dependent oxidoreductase [Desulfovibrio sp. OttesenSCG-928-M14]
MSVISAKSELNTPDAPLILTCSPRKDGNSDKAAHIVASTLAGACIDMGAVKPQVLFLRDWPVLPCVACGACEKLAAVLSAPEPGTKNAEAFWRKTLLNLQPGAPFLGCPLSRNDKSAPLFRALLHAPRIFLLTPIYFYHVPAILKALLDRCQAFWSLRLAGVTPPAPSRPCNVILIAARKQGDRLFEGSLLSLQYALAPLNLRLDTPLTLKGLDLPGDLNDECEAADAVREYAKSAVCAAHLATHD